MEPVILLFVYNRADLAERTLSSIEACFESESFDLIIYSDFPKYESHAQGVAEVRSVIKEFKGTRSVNIVERTANFGLAKSIITGVTDALTGSESVIVLEDDLILSNNFLVYMREALKFYKDKKSVLNISGFSYRDKCLENLEFDNFFWGRATSWGWATWADRWCNVNWELKLDDILNDGDDMKEFSKFGYDLPVMLKKQHNSLINSWAVRWCYHQHINKLLSVIPVKSKVINDGFGQDATHCTSTRDIDVDFDDTGNLNFLFDNRIEIESSIYTKYNYHYSRRKRVFERLKGVF